MVTERLIQLDETILGPIVATALHESGSSAVHLYVLNGGVLSGKAVAYDGFYERKMNKWFIRYALSLLGMPDSTHIQIPVGKGSSLDSVVENNELNTVENMFDMVFPALRDYWQSPVGRILLERGTHYLGLDKIVSAPLSLVGNTASDNQFLGVMAYGNPQSAELSRINEVVSQRLAAII